MALTRILRSLRSVLNVRAKERTAALDALYTLNAGGPVTETIDAFRMIELPSFSSGSAFCTVNSNWTSESAMIEGMAGLRRGEGIDASEEGGATLAALRVLVAERVPLQQPVVLFNTGTAYKYLDMIEAQEKEARPEPSAARNIGGIIGPY